MEALCQAHRRKKRSDENGDYFHKEPKECMLLSIEDVFENMYLVVKVHLSSGEEP